MGAVARLRDSGSGVQALKAALAAGLAWKLGGLIPGAPPLPYLAPLTAMLTVQLTIVESISGALQRTAGAVVGVTVALAVGGAVGVNAVTVAALVLLAQVIGRLLRLTTVGTTQVMTTALLVLTIGGVTSFNYGFGRVVETIVGALIGVGVNALLVPPTHFSEVVTAYRALANALKRDLLDLATCLRDGLTHEVAAQHLERARALERQFEQIRVAFQHAQDSLRMNVFGARQRSELDSYRHAVDTLEHTAIQVRTLTRALDDAVVVGRPSWLDGGIVGKPMADFVQAAAVCLEAFVERSSDLDTDVRSALASREVVIARASEARSLLAADGWLQLGSIVSSVERMVNDLGSPAADLSKRSD